MHWTLAGCCGFALISLSVALQISQRPRFYGLTSRRDVSIYCQSSEQDTAKTAEWYKAMKYDSPEKEIVESERIRYEKQGSVENAFLFFKELTVEDSGIYYCKINDTWGPGTEVQIIRPVNLISAQYRTQMKDGLIVLQGLLVAVCIGAYLLRKQKLIKDNDSVYEEPEADHIYEGLAIETCGGGLYEDLSAYARTEETEAPWE
ncbi:uncharacterized protein cd79b [Cyprinodon tularosa]|uniref:uncharacterized protein cd79b n=1 Tax=Cyprinodon tularosa TaxID=77115 RepID=UPI0018E24AC7|nr:uncharacterized protein cd79b [Cyprinodon tularosa]